MNFCDALNIAIASAPSEEVREALEQIALEAGCVATANSGGGGNTDPDKK